ncbi:hypothetical protein P8452_61199 [Trifolium repens]|nr:hypothetical protein P8452_61199 [Trifolium repens]
MCNRSSGLRFRVGRRSSGFSHAYDRIPHSDLTLENTISQIWEQTSVQNKSLFNGNKFRYGGQVLQTGGESDNEPHSEGTLERGASSRIYTLNSIRMGFILDAILFFKGVDHR